ncbi:hypothetical protein IDJ81_13905 [Tsuneonella flava]|uniref:DUF4129 domain-containing protein n=1 Tax=Tsuneonella flava TaxID=2055955 RepID=A0ABX7KFF3_9SPHN|nr:hypothetical protein IDJ81_13905 [Tsuneonella flava]
MTTSTGELQPAGEAWDAVRADSSIQYAPIPQPKTAQPPAWLETVFKWLAEVLGPIGRWLVNAWPVLKWALLALAIAALLYLLWKLIGPALGWRPQKHSDSDREDEWQPTHAAALALLEDADRLAAEGRFDEATHLLLQRSVTQIADARPDLVDPSSTARELAALPALPDAARAAFGTIATRVERSLFALRTLGADDWQIARDAYAAFALERIAR